MKQTCTIMQKSATYGIIMVAVLLCGTATLSSCEKKPPVISDPAMVQELPSLTAHNFETIYTDSGRVQLILVSPLLERYSDEQNPRNVFPKGLKATIYDGNPTPKSTISSHTAVYTERDKLWELRDSVVVVDESGSIMQTELLYWNEAKDMVWSDRFVKITEKDQIIMGTGYEYNLRLKKYRIKDVSATIYINNE